MTDGAWTYRGQPARRRAWTDLPDPRPRGLASSSSAATWPASSSTSTTSSTSGSTRSTSTRSSPAAPTTATTSPTTSAWPTHFGGDAALVALREATRARDIRLILDIAPNHVGVEHPWFQAAQADPAAPTASYFVFREHPDDYEAWLGVRSLPKLDYRAAGLRAAMYEADDAVLRRWLRPPFSADGWRIDVANMLGRLGPDQLGPEVARGMRAAVKAEEPDAYLLGEHAYDATDHLAGDQWDGVMDYWGFQRPVLDWLVRGRAVEPPDRASSSAPSARRPRTLVAHA